MTDPAAMPRPPGAMPLTGAQAGVWYAQRLDPSSPAYNTGEYVEIHGPVDPALFERALRLAVAEIDALNVTIGDGPDGPWQAVEPGAWPLHRLEVGAAPLRAPPPRSGCAATWPARCRRAPARCSPRR